MKDVKDINDSKGRYTIEIAGIQLKIVSDDSKEYIEKLASIINDRVDEMALQNKRCNRYEAMGFCTIDYLDLKLKCDYENKVLKAELKELKTDVSNPEKDRIINTLTAENNDLKRQIDELKAENNDYRDLFEQH